MYGVLSTVLMLSLNIGVGVRGHACSSSSWMEKRIAARNSLILGLAARKSKRVSRHSYRRLAYSNSGGGGGERDMLCVGQICGCITANLYYPTISSGIKRTREREGGRGRSQISCMGSLRRTPHIVNNRILPLLVQGPWGLWNIVETSLCKTLCTQNGVSHVVESTMYYYFYFNYYYCYYYGCTGLDLCYSRLCTLDR